MKKTCTLHLKFALAGIFAGLLTVQAADPTFWSWAQTPADGMEFVGLHQRRPINQSIGAAYELKPLSEATTSSKISSEIVLEVGVGMMEVSVRAAPKKS